MTHFAWKASGRQYLTGGSREPSSIRGWVWARQLPLCTPYMPHRKWGSDLGGVTYTSVSSFLFLSSLLSFSPSFSACPPWTNWSRRCTSSSTLSTCHSEGCEGQGRTVCPPAHRSAGTHHSEHTGPIGCALVHADPLVGHGLAETHFATGQALGELGYNKYGTKGTVTPSPPCSCSSDSYHELALGQALCRDTAKHSGLMTALPGDFLTLSSELPALGRAKLSLNDLQRNRDRR